MPAPACPIPKVHPNEENLIQLALRNASILQWVRALDLGDEAALRLEMADDMDWPVDELSSDLNMASELDWLWGHYRGEIILFGRDGRILP